MNELDTEIKFGENTKDDDLIIQIESWLRESRSYHDWLLAKQKVAEQYYLGNQTEKAFIPEHQSNTVENRIFEGVETLVPISTSAAHHFLVLPGSNSENSVKRADKLQKVLDIKYTTEFVQKKLEETTRHLLLYRFGVLKWGWDVVKDDLEIKVIDPRLILMPKLRCDPHDLPYKIELQEYTPEEVENYFPGKDFEKLRTNVTVMDKGEKDAESKKTFQVFEVWTKDYVCWYSNGEILDKKVNPYFDYEGADTLEGKKFNNFLDDPRDPYIFFTTFNVGDEPIGSISLVESVMDIQDEINVQKRQIIDNLRMMGNGQWLMDKSAMSKEEADNITNEPGLVLMGEGLVSENKARKEPALPLPNSHFANLQDSKVAFDNIFGLHSATRGAAASKTLGQDIMNRQQDLTRIDLITRVLNRGVQRLAEGLVQLMKLFYTESHVFKYLTAEDTVEFVNLNSGEIEEGTQIIVKSGRNPEYDRQQLGTMAIQLYQLGALAPGDLYRLLEMPNPEQMEQNLLKFKMGQLSMETQAEIQKVQAGATAKAGAENPAPQRQVETPANVMQRATQGLGGTAPIVSSPF